MQMRIWQKENETYKFHPLEPKFMRNHDMVNEDDYSTNLILSDFKSWR